MISDSIRALLRQSLLGKHPFPPEGLVSAQTDSPMRRRHCGPRAADPRFPQWKDFKVRKSDIFVVPWQSGTEARLGVGRAAARGLSSLQSLWGFVYDLAQVLGGTGLWFSCKPPWSQCQDSFRCGDEPFYDAADFYSGVQ